MLINTPKCQYRPSFQLWFRSSIETQDPRDHALIDAVAAFDVSIAAVAPHKPNRDACYGVSHPLVTIFRPIPPFAMASSIGVPRGIFFFCLFFSQRVISTVTNRTKVKLSGSMDICTIFIIPVRQLPTCLGGGTVAKRGQTVKLLIYISKTVNSNVFKTWYNIRLGPINLPFWWKVCACWGV